MILTIALLYFVILIVGAGLVTRRRIKSSGDFTAAEGTGGMGWIFVTCTFVLIPLGSGHSMSLWEQASVGGLGTSALLWALAVAAIFMPVMMLWLGPLARSTGFKTFPEITRNMYGRGYGWFHCAVSASSMSGIIAAELIATGIAISTLSSNAVPMNPWGILIATAFTILYVFFGGILQMAWINIVNSIVLIVGSFAALFGVAIWVTKNFIFGDASGLAAVAAAYTEQGNEALLSQFSFINTSGMWFDLIIPVALLHITALAVSQGHNVPFFAAKSNKHIRKGVYLASGLNAMSAVPWVLIAVVALVIPQVMNSLAPDEVGKMIVPAAALLMLPKPIIALLMISLLSATLSTAGSITLGSAQSITQNIIKDALIPNMTDKQQLVSIRIFIFVYVIICTIMALNLPVIMPVFFWCFTLSMPLFFNYITGMYIAINKAWCYVTLVCGYAVAFIWTFAGDFVANNVPYPLDNITYAVCLASIIPGMIIPAIIGRNNGKDPYLRLMREARANMKKSS